MHDSLRELLQCPVCAGALEWEVTARNGGRILEADVRCRGCRSAYSVQRGVAMLLPPDGDRVDLWEEAESALGRLLREQPEVERALLAPDPSELGPADLMYRALALEERGDFSAAREAAERADEGLYGPETRACRDGLLDALVAAVGPGDAPVVDLATGRGALVERLAARLDRPLIVTDLSPRVLLRTGCALAELGLAERVSLLACDARRTPFRDDAVGTLTTNVGLANVTEPGPLLEELRRVVSGRFLALTPLYPPDDVANGEAIRALGLDRMLYRSSLLHELERAGWDASLTETCTARADPTPVGVVVDGATIDALPVAPTNVEWAVLEVR